MLPCRPGTWLPHRLTTTAQNVDVGQVMWLVPPSNAMLYGSLDRPLAYVLGLPALSSTSQCAGDAQDTELALE
jgi:hypothetical protein